MQTNLVAIVVDQSGSMAHLKNDLRERTNKLISDIKARKDQDNRVGVYVFGSDVRGPFDSYPHTFENSSTALFDAVGRAVGDLSQYSARASGANFPWDKTSVDVAKLVIVLTDGEENASKNFEAGGVSGRSYFGLKPSFASLLKQKQAEGDWTFAFQLPYGHADKFARSFGVPRENLTEWENTREDYERTSLDTSNAFAAYSVGRSAGLKSSSSFYSAVTDLSDVKPKDLKQLDNLTARFKVWTVDKENDIKSFVESKSKQAYMPGTAFYQLTKPEKIQGNKSVALIEKGKKTILGGQNARKLVGLKDFADGKVTPGNHANYDIFVQSASMNRKLVRGSKLLVLK